MAHRYLGPLTWTEHSWNCSASRFCHFLPVMDVVINLWGHSPLFCWTVPGFPIHIMLSLSMVSGLSRLSLFCNQTENFLNPYILPFFFIINFILHFCWYTVRMKPHSILKILFRDFFLQLSYFIIPKILSSTKHWRVTGRHYYTLQWLQLLRNTVQNVSIMQRNSCS